MTTLRDYLLKYFDEHPFLEEALHENLLNVSALARQLMPDLEEHLGKELKEGAVIMAIRRLDPPGSYRAKHKLTLYIKSLGDIVVRSGLVDYTFINSSTLVEAQAKFLQELTNMGDVFHTFSRGVEETTVVVSQKLDETVKKCYAKERMVQSRSPLSSITVKLPQTNTDVLGLYYYLFKQLAQNGINVVEVISTTNEFTVIVTESDLNRAFQVIHGLKKN
ncbi:MAG: aspartate kinase [Bacteroidetes bacterium]|uniref:Aspartate kinase n=1 Tax=Phaeocystidibacter marisrubri TaxID=1577780 RepID=A0A6L3ZKM8_9FLAO|nr:aspartate kinase [Phaeocystidibacter marisrubri]KAB2817720.1 aspartate kinase [Phaeocystidibacter marisrubri]TNE30405.1 MAG: aspartate kinase [Bacteroidota bacterium]GGH73922.1 hypothetical protein GCM10011318_19370 [Phaeocystidibacter marisrubri]